MKDEQRDPNPGAASQDRKTRVKGDRVIHTVSGSLHHGDTYDRPRGLTTEENEEQLHGTKLDERQVREAAHGGLSGKQQVERLSGTDEVAAPKKDR